MPRPYPAHPRLFLLFVLLVLWVGCASAPLFSQPSGDVGVSSDREWQIQSFTAAANLDQQRIFDVSFDEEGRAWFGTSNGIWSFDGYSWTGYGFEDGLPSRMVRGLLWSSKRELWVATDRGAGVYDPVAKTFDRRGSEQALPNRNVRRVQEMNDGSLWFSCDQWPDISVGAGGLTRLVDGVWTTYQKDQGLPTDYVLGCFRTRRGEMLAFTPRGWVRLLGARWSSVPLSGDEPDTVIVQGSETFDGRLYLQGESQLSQLNGSSAKNISAESVLVCTRRNGTLVSLQRDSLSNRIHFAEWNGNEFVPASASVAVSPRTQFSQLVEAPDGAIWLVGQGLILRWSRQHAWSHFRNAPPLVALDSHGQPWFSGDGRVLWSDQLGFHLHPTFSQLVGIDREDVLLGRDATGKWWQQANLAARPIPAEVPVAQVYQSLNDAENRLWLIGRDEQSRLTFAHREAGKWVSLIHPDLSSRRLLSAQATTDSGLEALVTSSSNLGYALFRITTAGITAVELGTAAPELNSPSFTTSVNERILFGHSAAYELGANHTWNRINAVTGHGLIGLFAGRGQDLVIAYQNNSRGESGIALRHEGQWKFTPGVFDQLSIDHRSSLLLATGPSRLYRQREMGRLDFDTFALPESAYITRAFTDPNGRLWLNTTEGVFSRTPERRPVLPVVELASERVATGAQLQVDFAAREYMIPEPVRTRNLFSYRIDEKEFSDWGAGGPRAISVRGLGSGRHLLEVRTQSADGVVSPSLATAVFFVQSVPLQNRRWFLGAMVSLLATLVFFVWLGISRARAVVRSHRELAREFVEREKAEQALGHALADLKQAHNELEHRVAQRTLELSSANEALRKALEERELAEKDRAALEHQLREAQKMEAIGTLAGGIAHDFNNILTVIMPCTSIALDDAKHIPGVRENLSQVLQAAERAKHLVQQILAFSRRQKPEQRPTDLRVLVKETHHLLRSAIPSTIAVNLRLANDVPLVMADGTQLHQVLMNLCTNARHAVPVHGGMVTIYVDTLTLKDEDVRLSSELAAGLYVRVAVEDNGRGIGADVLPRIFEPFFTTKAPGEGTGLGLSVAHGIIKDHHGTIRVFSREGRGTRFDVLLPPAQDQLVSVETASPAPAAGHGEQILIVDDEFMVSRIISQVLTRNGYRPSVHTRPEVALSEFLKNPRRFHLLVTDLTMPGMNGLELARAVRGTRPDLPIILMTGYAGDVPPGVESKEVDRVAYKPFEANSLIRLVEQLLSERNQSHARRV